MLLYAVTPAKPLPDEGRRIQAMLQEGGWAGVHLRHPGIGPALMQQIVEAVDPALRCRLRLHDCHELATPLGVGAVHLNRRNPAVPTGWQGAVGASCHTLEELEECRRRGLAYATISPVFDSLSKAGYRAAFSPAELRRAAALAAPGFEVVALGGVTLAKLAGLEELGFSSAAMLTAAWQ